MSPEQEAKVRAVLAWLDSQAAHSRTVGYYADAYEIAADRLREALASDSEGGDD
jgi:hypothetical protein